MRPIILADRVGRVAPAPQTQQPERPAPRPGGILDAVAPAMRGMLEPLAFASRRRLSDPHLALAIVSVSRALATLDAKLRELDAEQAQCPHCNPQPQPQPQTPGVVEQ